MNYEFPVSVYGKIEKFSDTISRARVRIFYKGLNRNSTYITEEFAEKLISSLAYVPVKGIYDSEGADYEDHGKARNEGRIYGIVPADMNFAWEDHEDEDGETRTYACCDVLLYTALYGEASQIIDKGQSMEIYRPSIKGKWVYMNGKKVYQYEDGCFLGLQVLGDDVEPCFEGAAFFSMYEQIEDIYAKLQQCKNLYEKGGNKPMNGVMNFKLSDNEKYQAIWNLLNADYYTEENNWAVRYGIMDVYDDYAICRDYSEGQYVRQYYTKNDEQNSVELGKQEVCYFVNVNEAEKEALDKYRESEGTYEKLDETFANLKATNETLTAEKETLTADYAAAQTSLEEANGKITTFEATVEELNGKVEEFTAQTETLQNSIDALTSENEGLKQFKLDTEMAEKRAVVDSYAEQLDEEVINEYTNEKLADMSKDDLEKELCYKLVKANPSVFSKAEPTPIVLPKADAPKTGIEGILSKYKK